MTKTAIGTYEVTIDTQIKYVVRAYRANGEVASTTGNFLSEAEAQAFIDEAPVFANRFGGGVEIVRVTTTTVESKV